MNIPVFCINLEVATDRKDRIKNTWIDELGFDIIFHNAWRSEDIKNNNHYFSYSKELTQQTIKRQLTPSEIACATSHCMVYEHAIKNNIDYCIVMEDDIIPTNFTRNVGKEGFFDLINDVILNEPDIDIVFLFDAYHKLKNSKLIKETKNLYMYEKLCWGNQMILLSNRGLQKMYNNLKDMTYLADHWNIFPHTSSTKDIGVIKTPLGIHPSHNSTNYNSYITRS